jgi:hypothetical protein
MKSLLHTLSRVLLLLVCLATGIFLMAASLSADAWQLALALLQESRWMAGWVGLGVVSLGVLFMFSGVKRRRRTRFLSFDNDGGTVSISADAIAEYVGKLADEFPSVIRMTTDVVPHRGALDLRIRVRARSGCQVSEMCQLMQQRVRDCVVAGLGITQIRRIEVSVGEIVSEHKPRA